MKRKLKPNDSFSNALINLKISNFENFYSFSKNIEHSTLKATFKYRKHPSVIAVASDCFSKKCNDYSLKEISMLDSSKVIQATEIFVKIKEQQ